MDQNTKPANQGGNGGNRNKHHRRKPFYIKKKNEGENNNQEARLDTAQSAEPSVKESVEPHNENTPQGGERGENRHNNNHRRDRNRNRRNRDRKHNDGAENVKNADNIALTESEEEVEFVPFEAESVADETPEVIVSIEDEVVEIEDNTPRVHVTGVRFKPGGKVYYFDPGELKIKNNSYVIVDTARGQEFGEVAFGDKEVKETALVLPLRQVIRVATDADVERNAANKEKEEEAFAICQEKIAKHQLDMKLIEAQYSFDNSKLLFYFTSANRVDFRELVKDLASVFRTRIELRQIGIRDEAKIMGGLGACGRPLCCATFLSDFVQVSIKMAKEQNLSLNSGKISGCCGRLMCCLQYEYQTYREEGAKTPSVDSTVKTPDGVGVVTESNALAGTIKVKLKDKPDSPPALYKRDDVTVLNRAKREDDDEK